MKLSNDSQNFKYLQNLINQNTSVILDEDIRLDSSEQFSFSSGIILEENNITIDGAGHVIESDGTRLFKVSGYDIHFKNITFKTKAEAKYIAVGAASIIARYIFLNEMDKMNRQYNFDFHKGAGVIVDQRIHAFIEKYSRNELAKVGKLNFKNYKKLEG